MRRERPRVARAASRGVADGQRVAGLAVTRRHGSHRRDRGASSASATPPPSASPGFTGSVDAGSASLAISGAMHITEAALPLTGPTIYSPPPGPFALGWDTDTAAFALSGTSFVGNHPTSATLELTFSIGSGSDATSFASDDGGCDVIVTTAETGDVRRHVLVHRHHRRGRLDRRQRSRHVQRHGVADGPQRHVAHRHRPRVARRSDARRPRRAAGTVRPARVPLRRRPRRPRLPLVDAGRRVGRAVARRRTPGQPRALRGAGGGHAPARRRGHRRVRGGARRGDRRGHGDARPRGGRHGRGAPRGPRRLGARRAPHRTVHGAPRGRVPREPRVRRSVRRGGDLPDARHAAEHRPGRDRARRRRSRASAVLPDRRARVRGGGRVVARASRARLAERRGAGGPRHARGRRDPRRRPARDDDRSRASGGRHVEGRVPPASGHDRRRPARVPRARAAPVDALRAMARAPVGGAGTDADERLRAPRARGVGGARGDRRARSDCSPAGSPPTG